MKICIAQTKPIKGDIEKNIKNHIKLIDLAVKNEAEVIIFPELSLTGYEAEIAEELATSKDDKRFNEFQKISDSNKIMIAAGLPTINEKGTCISLVIFQPNNERLIYSKKYLHPGEDSYFVTGKNLLPITFKDKKIAFAICYETSINEHTKEAFNNDADIYLASVLNSITGVDNDINRISDIAKKHKVITAMSNFVGKSGGYDCAGKSSIWNTEGDLISQLNDLDEGIIIVDTNTQKADQFFL